MQRNFKPMPGDHRIEDEDERCRVRNREFVDKRRRRRERNEKLAFGILYGVAIILAASFFWLMSR